MNLTSLQCIFKENRNQQIIAGGALALSKEIKRLKIT